MEVSSEGLVLPESPDTTIFADHRSWIPIAEVLAGRPLPKFLRALCRSYAEAVLNCVEIDSDGELEEEEEVRSYTCYKRRGRLTAHGALSTIAKFANSGTCRSRAR